LNPVIPTGMGFPRKAILGKGFQAKPSGSKNPEGFLFPDCCNFL